MVRGNDSKFENAFFTRGILTAAFALIFSGCASNADLGFAEGFGAGSEISPLQLDGSAAVQVSAGNQHTCVVTYDHHAFCWGRNDYSQLGDGQTIHSFNPVQVLLNGLPLTNVSQIVAGQEHTCALTSDGNVYCYGRNFVGQLGTSLDTEESADGSQVTFSTLAAGEKIIQITGGSGHNCALSNQENVFCWGAVFDEDQAYSISDGTVNSAWTNAIHPGIATKATMSGVKHLVSSKNTSCASTDITLYCWGSNGSGGFESTTARFSNNPSPQPFSSVVGLFSGPGKSICARFESGDLRCWGKNTNNYSGQNNPLFTLDTVFDVDGIYRLPMDSSIEDATFLSFGSDHACKIKPDQSIECWGSSYLGQIGAVNSASILEPSVPFSGTFVALSAGVSHTCAVTEWGSVKCIGDNEFGQLGSPNVGYLFSSVDRSDPDSPVVVGVPKITFGDISFESVFVGPNKSCGISIAGDAYCWGGYSRELASQAKKIEDVLNVSKIWISDNQTCVAGMHNGATTSEILCHDHYSGLATWSAPFLSVDQFALGKNHACWVETVGGSNSTVNCVTDASNDNGQLGIPTVSLLSSTLSINGIVTKIFASGDSTCAISTVSVIEKLYCWGKNNQGQLGSGTTVNLLEPTNILTLAAGKSFADFKMTDDTHGAEAKTCALINEGGENNSLICWGRVGWRSDDGWTSGSGSLPKTAITMYTESLAVFNDTGNVYTGPFALTTGEYAKSISLGSNHICMITNFKTRCVGREVSLGQLGNVQGEGLTAFAGAREQYWINDNLLFDTDGGNEGNIADVLSYSGAGISTYGDSNCFVSNATGKVHCFGSNRSGQLGTGDLGFSRNGKTVQVGN